MCQPMEDHVLLGTVLETIESVDCVLAGIVCVAKDLTRKLCVPFLIVGEQLRWDAVRPRPER